MHCTDDSLAQEQLRNSEVRSRLLVEQLPYSVQVIDPSGRTIQVNDAWERLWGVTMDQIANYNLLDDPQLVENGVAPYIQRALQGEAVEIPPVRYVPDRGDFAGEERWTRTTVYPVLNPDRSVREVVLIHEDVTARKSTDDQLRRSHDTFYKLIQNNPFGVYVVDASFRLREVSLGSKRVFQNVQPLLGRDFAEVLRIVWAEPFATEAIERFRHTLATGEPYVSPSTVEYRQDICEVEAYDWRIERITLPDGLHGVVCYFYDLSERQRWERALQESEARLTDQKHAFELAVSGAPIHDVLNVLVVAGQRRFGSDSRTAIFIVDPHSAGLRFGAAAGLSAEAAEDFAVTPINPACGSADTTSKTVVVRDVAEDPLWASCLKLAQEHGIRACWSFPICASDEKVIGTFAVYHREPREPAATDLEHAKLFAQTAGVVIERHRAEDALRQSEERFRLATQTGKVGVWDWDIRGQRVTWTDSLYAIHGLTKEEFQPTAESFASLVHPEDVASVSAALKRALEEGAPYEMTFRALHTSGEVIWLFTNAVVVRSAGEPVRLLGATVDVTKLKRVEEALRQNEERLRLAKEEAERANRAKDHFLARLSHELRNPLNPVLINATDMLSDDGLAPATRQMWEMVRKNVALEAALIDDLLDLTRISMGKVTMRIVEVDAHAVLLDAVETVRQDAVEKRLLLGIQLLAEHPQINADSVRLQQIFSNVLTNAVKFSEPLGEIHLSTRDGDGEKFVVEITDTGLGMTAEELAGLFNPFEQGEHAQNGGSHRFGGLGLGMAITQQLVELHGGSIRAESTGRQQGSKFTIELPAGADLLGGIKPDVQAVIPHRLGAGNGAARPLHVLLIEDHEATRETLQRVLSRRGYEITSAASAAEARALAGKQQFDVVLSDLGLPDGDGLALMAELRGVQGPLLRGIAMSGYGMPEDLVRSQDAGFSVHLTKPVAIEALEGALQQLVGQAANPVAAVP